jgi:UDP-N-acetylmuramoyl-tripeptide--D-alanyl-D-alanine ligase
MISIESLYQIFLRHPSVQTDSRKIREGDLFFALKGDKFNGNLYAKQALELGASYAIVDEPNDDASEKLILVDHVLETLQELARHHRKHFNIPFIAITGSNGKTTTKELIHAALARRYTTYTTEGNLNNHIGIPLTLLRVRQDAEMAVIEMGANHLNEIEGYCSYALPTHGIITNCGKAHLEGFGSIEGVKKGKGELYDFLRDHGGTVFAMWDYDYLREMIRGIHHVITYGTKDAGVTGQISKSQPYLSVKIEAGDDRFEIDTSLVGEYNLPNILAAVTVGLHFDVAASDIKESIEKYNPSNSRSQLIDFKSNKVILDAYNANPTSMRAAIENFAHMQGAKKILMLGGMAELGQDSLAEHQQILDLIQRYHWEDVLLVGGDFLKLDHPFRSFSTSQEAKEWAAKRDYINSYWLVKGSRSMQMEKVIEP